VHDDTLVIEGELKFSVPEGAKAIWQEFGPSKFRRSLRLGSMLWGSMLLGSMARGSMLLGSMALRSLRSMAEGSKRWPR